MRRHDLRRWVKSVKGHFDVAHDCVCEGRRGDAMRVLCGVVDLATAIRLVDRAGRLD